MKTIARSCAAALAFGLATGANANATSVEPVKLEAMPVSPLKGVPTSHLSKYYLGLLNEKRQATVDLIVAEQALNCRLGIAAKAYSADPNELKAALVDRYETRYRSHDYSYYAPELWRLGDEAKRKSEALRQLEKALQEALDELQSRAPSLS